MYDFLGVLCRDHQVVLVDEGFQYMIFWVTFVEAMRL